MNITIKGVPRRNTCSVTIDPESNDNTDPITDAEELFNFLYNNLPLITFRRFVHIIEHDVRAR